LPPRAASGLPTIATGENAAIRSYGRLCLCRRGGQECRCQQQHRSVAWRLGDGIRAGEPSSARPFSTITAVSSRFTTPQWRVRSRRCWRRPWNDDLISRGIVVCASTAGATTLPAYTGDDAHQPIFMAILSSRRRS
jgi:hypothetical protein